MNTCYELGLLCKLRDWIPIEKLAWTYLSRNPNAIHLLEQNIDKIDWYYLSANPCIKNYVDTNNRHNQYLLSEDVEEQNRFNLFKAELKMGKYDGLEFDEDELGFDD